MNLIYIAISESWINDNNTFIYNIPNYNAYVSNILESISISMQVGYYFI